MVDLVDLLHHLMPALGAARRGLVLDFDGTISHIAPTSDEAVVTKRAARSLHRLVNSLELVCIMSDRAVGDLRARVGIEGVLYVGNHGAEYLDGDRLSVAPEAEPYRERVNELLSNLKSKVRGPEYIWHDKGYSASVHYRLAEDTDRAKRLLSEAVDSAATADLEVFWGKMVLEIRTPSGVDKGYAVRRLVRERGLESAIVVGDDTTDADALSALRDMRARGVIEGAGVAVLYEDTPRQLVELADYVLRGVEEVEDFLEWVEGAARR